MKRALIALLLATPAAAQQAPTPLYVLTVEHFSDHSEAVVHMNASGVYYQAIEGEGSGPTDTDATLQALLALNRQLRALTSRLQGVAQEHIGGPLP